MKTGTEGRVLEALRLARGLTQVELAAESKISQAVLSKLEAGTLALDSERASALADVFEVPVGFFRESIGDEARIFHRKRASLPITADKRIRAHARVLQAQISALLGEAKPTLRLEKRPLPDDRLFTPTDRARETRHDLGLREGPIPDLIAVLEAAGVLVIREDLSSLQVDAIAVWPDAGTPVVLFSDHAPADRQRFTAAHEIGHAVMHDIPTPLQEAEADQFAAEFLMPRKSILADLDDLSFPHLVAMKAKWGVSIAAIARRALDLGKMTERQYRNFNVHMASTGMHRLEPNPLTPETPAMLNKYIREQLAAGTTLADLADTARMTQSSFTRQFALEKL